MKKLVAIVLLMVVPALVGADMRKAKSFNTGITDGAGNTTHDISPVVDTSGWRVMTLEVDFDETATSATAVTMTCFSVRGEDIVAGAASKKYAILACDGSTTPTLTCEDGVWSKAIVTDDTFVFNVTITNYENMTCTFAVTGGDASDDLTVYGRLGA